MSEETIESWTAKKANALRMVTLGYFKDIEGSYLYEIKDIKSICSDRKGGVDIVFYGHPGNRFSVSNQEINEYIGITA